MKNIFSILTTIILLGSLNAQTAFQNTVGVNQTEILDVAETQDGGFVMVAKTADHDPMNMSLSSMVIRTDINGDTLWVVGFSSDTVPVSSGGMLNASTVTNSIDTTTDGGFIISGSDGGAILVKLNASGVIQWTKRYKASGGGGLGVDAHQTSDGGYMVAGSRIGASGNNDFWLIKTDLNGDTLWTRTYDTGENDALRAMNLTTDGGCIMGGTQYVNSPGYHKFLMMKISPSGSLDFSKTYSSSFGGTNMYLTDIIQTSDLNYIAVGGGTQVSSGYGFPYAIKLDISGIEMWAGDYRNDGGVTGLFTGVSETLDGNIVTSGSSEEMSGSIVITKINTTTRYGIWRQTYGIYGGNEQGNSIVSTTDGSIVVVGKGGFNNPFNGGYMIKADSLGISGGCFNLATYYGSPGGGSEVDAPTTVTNLSCVVTTIPMQLFSGTEYHKLITTLNISKTDPLCVGDCNGNATVVATEGQPPYNYLWSTGGNLDTDIGLCESTYYITVTDVAGCVTSDSITLVEPTAIQVSSVVNDVTCFGDYDGGVDLTVSGGTPGYTYSWPTGATSQDISGLSGGYYQVVVTDSNGCESTLGAIVYEPQPLATYITQTTNASCNNLCDGKLASLTVGGTTPYSVTWNDPSSQVTDTASGLCDGQYLIIVTDDNGCMSLANGTITEPTALTSVMNSTPSECGLAIGSANVVVGGGTVPYQYLWSNTSITDTVYGLNQGMHGVTITDTNGCTLIDSIDIQTITAPTEICVVTVSDQNQNIVVWEKPIVNNLAGYNIYRNIAGSYSQVGYTPYDSLSQFVDLTFGVDPNVTSYRYKISAVDTCGGESALSNHHETIHLTSSLGVGGEVNLIWDDYEGFPFASYNILLDSTETGNYFVLANVPNTNFTYTDFNPPSDSADYLIEVIIPVGCTSTKANHNTTRSNKGKPGSIMTKVFNQEILNKASVYPNPASQSLNIELNGSNNWEYKIFNVTGKLIQQETQINTQKRLLNIKNWPKGIYLIQIQVGDQFVNRKIIKQ